MLEKAYSPKDVESKHYQRWEEKGYFKPAKGTKDAFAIMMPPPNVTGTLHVGHALDNTLPDILTRRARMQGKAALYQPGCDHASIAVHVVLDKQFKEEGVNRFEIGRDEFMSRAWKWKEFSQSTIQGQMKRLGISCDWSKFRFTMDDDYQAAIEKTFIELYNRGLIYRGQRLVNWDPVMQTAVSDLEVKHKEKQGHMWSLNYPLTDGSGHVTIATTRPETMLGDTAIIAHPDDERYKGLFGKTVTLPIVGREIPIIADDYVDMEFGSGCMKVTPAHDFNDFEIGKRHDLEMINILTREGKVNQNAPEEYQGLDRFDARKKVVAEFEELGLLEKIEDHVNNVGHAERNDTILEPFLTEQWYVKAAPLAEKCLKAMNDGELDFILDRDKKIYTHWLENIQDWCISRQLWWGHRIPAWHHTDGTIKVQSEAPEGEGWTQDADILDTWFSSALWPFATQGWPETTEDLAKFYPNFSIMPGRDILFFWVIRMVMMGLELTGKAPFKTIYTHMMVLDEHGQKMSKSKGNVVDPIVLMDKYGTDALRYTLVNQCALGQDIRLSDKSVEIGRNFCTKMWNAAKFAQMNEVTFSSDFDPSAVKNPVNKWIIGKLGEAINSANKAMDEYRFNDLASTLYHFMWNTYCDWYLELTKPLMYGNDEALKAETRAVMGNVLETTLRLMHPMMPFITEEIWQGITENNEESSIMVQAWPNSADWPVDSESVQDVDWLINVVTSTRAARSENNVPPKAKVEALVRGASGEDSVRLATYLPFFEAMTNVVSFNPLARELSNTDVAVVAEGFEIILPLEGHVDFEAEKERVQKEISKFEAELGKINGMLGNASFVERAPEHVVKEQQDRKEVILTDLSKLKEVLEAR